MTQFDNYYGTVLGELLPEYSVPGVENAFRQGSSCDLEYEQILQARQRLYQRLGVEEEDEDMEIIFNSFLRIQNEIAEIMFRLGMRHGEHENQE